tara:strand:- start:2613 stop:2810 length:198 start_codon:yes stop_codon:yes gene_type:complete
MSKVDTLKRRIHTLEKKHKELDRTIQSCYTNVNIDDEVRKMKTLKLWYKDEMHLLNQQLIQMVLK